MKTLLPLVALLLYDTEGSRLCEPWWVSYGCAIRGWTWVSTTWTKARLGDPKSSPDLLVTSRLSSSTTEPFTDLVKFVLTETHKFFYTLTQRLSSKKSSHRILPLPRLIILFFFTGSLWLLARVPGIKPSTSKSSSDGQLENRLRRYTHQCLGGPVGKSSKVVLVQLHEPIVGSGVMGLWFMTGTLFRSRAPDRCLQSQFSASLRTSSRTESFGSDRMMSTVPSSRSMRTSRCSTHGFAPWCWVWTLQFRKKGFEYPLVDVAFFSLREEATMLLFRF
jgi:hypothetical protein